VTGEIYEPFSLSCPLHQVRTRTARPPLHHLAAIKLPSIEPPQAAEDGKNAPAASAWYGSIRMCHDIAVTSATAATVHAEPARASPIISAPGHAYRQIHRNGENPGLVLTIDDDDAPSRANTMPGLSAGNQTPPAQASQSTVQ